MDTEKRAMLDRMVLVCAGQLFAGYGVHITAGGPVPDPSCVAGIVGLAGHALAATVVIATSGPVLAATSGDMCTTAIDWVGELANQLAGRLKNELLRWGVEVHLSTPVTLAGGSRLGIVDHRLTHDLSFDTTAGTVRLWLKAEEVAPFALVQRTADAALDEGALLFF